MARRPRLHFPGALYHVILRGNGGDPVFFDEADRCRFYLLLQEGTERFGCRIHAFCCMTNHIHLALQVGDLPLSRLMQNLSLRYTAWINRRQDRKGHLFQGRYMALLIDHDNYLLELVRYIHLNPVRAGMVAHPDDYPWSGHGAYLGREIIPWLTTDYALGLLAPTKDESRRKYAGFVAEGFGEGHRHEFHRGPCEGRILGDDLFVEKVLHRAGEGLPVPAGEVIDAVCREFAIDPEALRQPGKARPASTARAWTAWLVRELPGGTLAELGTRLGRDVVSLSQAAGRLEKLRAMDAGTGRRLDALLGRLRKV